MQPDPTDLIVEVLAIELHKTNEEVRAARSLRGDLGMDSIAAANVLFSLEEELGLELDLEDVEGLDSLSEIVAVVDRFRPSVGA